MPDTAEFVRGALHGAVGPMSVLVVRMLGRAFPPRLGRPRMSDVRLKRRNRWITVGAIVIFFAQLGFALWEMKNRGPVTDFVARVWSTVGLPGLVCLIGAYALVPVVWGLLVTLPFGRGRLLEYWQYCERRDGTSIFVSLTLIAILLAVVATCAGIAAWRLA